MPFYPLLPLASEVSSETSIAAFLAVIYDLRAMTKGYPTKKRINAEFPHHRNYLCGNLFACLGDVLRDEQNRS